MSRLTRLVLFVALALLPQLASAQSVQVIGMVNEDTPHVDGDLSMPIVGVRMAACGTALSGTNGDYNPIQFDANGNLCTSASLAGTKTNNTAAPSTDLVPVLTHVASAAAQAYTEGRYVLPRVDLFGSTAVTFMTSGGAVATLATDGTDDSAAPSTGPSMMGFADEVATDSVDEGDTGKIRMTLDRKLIATLYPHTAGGLSIYRSIDLDEGAGEVVKASPGQLYALWVANTATTTRFLKIYNATSCTMGTGTPVLTIPIPGNSSDDIAGSFVAGGHGIEFTTGICFGATTGVADADTGAPGANDVIANALYK